MRAGSAVQHVRGQVGLGARGPRSSARLSAIASSRRIRPATASLVSGGSASWPSSSRLACLCSSRSRPALVRCSGASSPRISSARSTRGPGGDRGPGGPAQVGVVEVGQPVGGGPDLAAHPALLPGQHAVVRAEPGQQRADGVAVADHDPVDPADLAGLGRDAQPAGGTDQRQRGLRSGAGDLQRRGAAGLGERAVRQEGAAPGGRRVAGRAGDDLRAAGRAPGGRAVEQAGLAGQRLAVLDHAYDVAVAAAQAAGGQHGDLADVAEDLGDLPAQPAGGRAGVQLGLDHDPAADDVQAAGEPQHRRHLGLAAAGLGDREPTQLVLDRRRHRHGSPPCSGAPHRTPLPAASGHDAAYRRPRQRNGEAVRVAASPGQTRLPRHRDRAQSRPGPPPADRSGEHDVDGRPGQGACAEQHLQVLLRREARGLPCLRREVESDEPAGRRTR